MEIVKLVDKLVHTDPNLKSVMYWRVRVRYRLGEGVWGRRRGAPWRSQTMPPWWRCWVSSLTRSYCCRGEQNPSLLAWKVIFLSCEHSVFTEKLLEVAICHSDHLKSSFKSSIMNSILLLLVPLNSASSLNRSCLELCPMGIPHILSKHWVLMHVESPPSRPRFWIPR